MTPRYRQLHDLIRAMADSKGGRNGQVMSPLYAGACRRVNVRKNAANDCLHESHR